MLKPKPILKIVVILSALSLLAILLVNSQSLWLESKNQSLSVSSIEIIIETPLPQVPASMDILRLVSKNITAEQALDITSRIFCVNGETKFVDDCWITREGPQEVSIYKSGSVYFSNDEKMYGTNYLLQDFPSIADCVTIAQHYLGNLTAQGLALSKSLGVTFGEVANDTTVFAYRNGTAIPYINNIHVNFRFSYNGYELSGAGAKLRVYIGKGGEVIGFIGNFWEVEPYKHVQIITPQQAIDRLNQTGFGLSMPKAMITQVVINSISLVYWVSSPLENPLYITPTYNIKGTITGTDGRVVDFVQTIPASLNG